MQKRAAIQRQRPCAFPFDILMRAVAYFIRMPNEQKAGVLQGTLDLMVLQTLATLGTAAWLRHQSRVSNRYRAGRFN